MTRRARLVAGAGVLAAAVAVVGWAASGSSAVVPSAEVTRGEFVDALQIRAEIKATRSVTLLAPSRAGELRIVKIARSGTAVKKGDVVAEFAAATVARTVQEKETELRGLEAEIERTRSDTRTRVEQAATAETTAKFDLERAKLDYSARDLLPRVDAEQKRLAVLDAEHKLREASAKLASERASVRAEIAAVEQKRDKAAYDLATARRQLQALTLVAPTDGIVTLLPNRAGGFNTQQDFKVGDRAWPGAPVAELPDVSSLYASARVDEIERGRLRVGLPATLRTEALPDRTLSGRIGAISALAKTDFSSWPPPRNFDLSVAIDDHDDRLRPGMTANVRIAVETLADVVLVPSQAVFQVNGEDIVYVTGRGEPQPRRIEIDRRGADQVVVKNGLAAGERVALSDPTRAAGGRR